MKINFIKVKNGVMLWKQIEKKNGKTFMRMKQRFNPIVALKGNPDQFNQFSSF